MLARNKAKIVNRTNVCGGPKKAGLGPSIGNNPYINMWRAPSTLPVVCVPNHTTQTQNYGYRATLG